jgi:HEAT repeat protein
VVALAVLLKAKAATVRLRAAEALTEIGPGAAEALPALQEATKDRDAEVATAATLAIQKNKG